MSMISELVKGLRKLGHQWKHNDVAGCNLIFDAADTIEILSTKLSKHNLGYGEWIPVSERLPKYMVDMWDEGVIATVNGRVGNIIYENGIVPDAWFEDGKWYVNGVELENAKVVAWMPLPEPYRGESEGE